MTKAVTNAATKKATPAKVKATKATKAAEKAKRFPTQAKIDAEKAAKKAAPKAAKPVVKKVTKTTTKAAPKATPKATSKATEKLAKATAAFVARVLPKGKMAHVIAQDARPTQGVRLFAHTHAALHLLGLFSPALPAVSERAVLTIMGQRAVAYHRKENNFTTGPNYTLSLTPAGYTKFKARGVEGKIDGKLANAFLDLFIDGKVDPALQVPADKVYQVGL